MIIITTILGIITWTFLEYIIYCLFLHKKKADNPLTKEHHRHHSEGDYFAPAWAKAILAFIVLTTITTAAGLAPIIFLRSEQGQFLVPMAVSVAFGLIFGTILTLLALPSALFAINDLRVVLNKMKNKKRNRCRFRNWKFCKSCRIIQKIQLKRYT